MIEFKSYASSSSGNLYTVSDGDSFLVLECGLPIKKIRRGLRHRLNETSAVLLTHSHSDHSKAAKEILSSGIDLYCSRGTAEDLGIVDHHRTHIIRALEQFRVGKWTILAFDVQHDVNEPLGYLIQNGTDKHLFSADTYFLKYRFVGLTGISIECNYSKHTIREDIPSAQKHRLLRSHMSLETLLDFLAANDLSAVREIHLLHLSDNNSDEDLFKDLVQGNTGIPVYVAGK